jgi:L-ascorbate metabolism protein UlaG (beta-lactamase superfamily)
MKRARLSFTVLLVAAVLATAYAMTRDDTFPQPVIAPQGAAAPRPPGATVEITYIANEGVLIDAGGKRVLIDGLHREYRPAYPFLPEPHREQIETAQPPFDRIDVILVSHVHLDHFHPESVARHLRHDARTVLVSSGQVVREVEKEPEFGAIRQRVRASTPPLRERIATTAGGVEIELLGLGHGSGRNRTLQNLGHIVRLGGKKILHIGDADPDAGIFAAFSLDKEAIDVAVLPVWFLTSDAGAAIVREQIKPRHIVAVHMPAHQPERSVAQIKERFPDAAAFTALLDKRYY